jgi:hypothetical protein
VPELAGIESKQEKIMTSGDERAHKIAALNDAFRTRLPAGGRVLVTAGVDAKGAEFVAAALAKVRSINTFTADNDPHGEHDFGAFALDGEKLFWKIDYYDRDEQHGAEDPSDASKTLRVMTVMLAQEY